MVGSNLTDPSIGAVNIVHEGEEDYHNIWYVPFAPFQLVQCASLTYSHC